MQDALHAQRAGSIAPANDKAHGEDVGQVGDEKIGQPDSANSIATLQARFALAGLQLHQLEDGTLLMSRWGLSRVFNDSAAAERFVASLGVA